MVKSPSPEMHHSTCHAVEQRVLAPKAEQCRGLQTTELLADSSDKPPQHLWVSVSTSRKYAEVAAPEVSSWAT